MKKKRHNRLNLLLEEILYTSSVMFVTFIFLANTNTYPDNPSIRQLKIPEKTIHKEDLEKWQKLVRKKLSEILYMPSTKPDSFEAKRIKIEENGKYEIEEYEIKSTLNRCIRICLGVPVEKGDRKYPAVVCIHGHGGNRYTPFEVEPTPYHEFGRKLLKKGYVVVSTDIGQHEIFEKGRTLMGERLWDLIRCVDYLETLPYVDKNRIGCAGLSLGGEMAMWLGAMDTRIKATVVCGFLTYMDQMEKNHCLCWKFPGLREQVDFPDIYALVAPRPLQCQNGEKEPPNQFPPSLAQKAWEEIIPVYKAFKAEDKAELIIHRGGHEIAIEPMLTFLKKHLKD